MRDVAYGLSDISTLTEIITNIQTSHLQLRLNIHTHTHSFNGPFSGTTRVSRYQKGKPIWILLEQETVSGSGISWTIGAYASLHLASDR